AIKQWIKALHGKVSIAVEATNVYHLLFTDMVHEAGHTLYLMDARVLARYLKNEGANLSPWIPPSTLYRDLVSLFRRRAMLVQT
ncbi:IS110 family transposase, partial [Pseudomonas entomophila]|nr:IS110 family transposase [Pseudomonas entomophila]